MFASTQAEQRARRPTDIALAIASVSLLIVIRCSRRRRGPRRRLAGLLTRFPGFFDPLWKLLFWTPVVWACSWSSWRACAVGCRWAVISLASVVSVAAAAIGAAIVTVSRGTCSVYLADIDGPPVFPPGALAIATAAICTASPHLSRPFRHFGRWLIVGQLTAALFLGAASPAARLRRSRPGCRAAIVHLLWVAGRPSDRVADQDGARGPGGEVDDSPGPRCTGGVVLFSGTDQDGPLPVKVYGRDAWDAQLLANLWRLAWYRGGSARRV